LGVLEPEATLHDVIAGECSVENSIQIFGNLHALLGSIAFGEEIAPLDLRGLLEPLMGEYRVIILDTAPGLGAEVIAAIKASDEIIAVTNPEIPTITSTLKTFRAAERYRVPISGVVVNKVRGGRFEVSMKEVKRTLEWPVLIDVPEDEKVRESLWVGKPIVHHAPNSKAAIKFREFAEIFFKKLTGR
jgi:septum site-determining protein MinD